MVAKIKSGKSLIGALNYNENKVKQAKAKLIAAARYPKDIKDMNFYDKLHRLTDLAERNERTKTNTVHVSLNFANGENLNDEKLSNIAEDYIQGIGFETQPYLVYRHFDAGHPHIHLVTTNIKSNGYRISLHYLGQNESEKARKAIEIKYGLVKAEEQEKQKPDLKADLKTIDYGKAETKRAITNVVGQVVRNYKFTSIPELNAILLQFNVQADRGFRDSRINMHEGLVYWIVDSQGNKLGVPIKASSIYGKPTLKTLKEKFRLNEQLRKPLKDALKTKIAKALQKAKDRPSFEKALRDQNIAALFRYTDEGRIYGTTFIDQENKVVFNGRDLDKQFSANPLNEFFNQSPTQTVTGLDPANTSKSAAKETPSRSTYSENNDNDHSSELLDILFQPDREDMGALNQIKRQQQKRKGQNL
ncbi:relaxase/mobilization nuclease domain-containing protein [Mucilaginibacter sp. AW1-3]